MKLLRFACLFLGAVAVFDGASGAVVRQDNSQVPGIHAIGNGGLCVYGQGADILQLFGPPYSSPGFFTMNLQGDYRVDLQREPRTAVWHSLITDGGAEVARQTDFVTVGSDGFVRRIHAQRPFSYRITVRMEDRYAPYEELITVREDMSAAELKNANRRYRIGIAPGVPFYSSYKAPSGYLYEVFTTGSATLVPGAGGDKSWVLNVTPGDGALYVVAGPNERRLAENSAAIASASPESLQKASAKSWKKYAAKQHRFKASNLPDDRRDEFFRAVDDIGVLIKSQQGREGGVLAGIVYHMGYVRDQYGVSRALLALGHSEEARGILEFYHNIWKAYGYIQNAQAIGYPGIFHRHENDETEITGYLVVQAFDYFRKTNDAAFLERILPMLEWATQAQQRNLIDGMLPFNGDETYIAGGVVPRKVMYHGSAEATLLFIEGSSRLLDFVRTRSLWNEDRIAALERDVRQCSDRYRDNFYQDGKLFINNPQREAKVSYPATRPGVCLHPDHFDYFTETYHFKGCLYFCEDCMRKDNSRVELPPVERFSIPSAYLFPIYINAQLLSDSEKRALLDEVVALYRKTGKISSQDRILGYDFGMFLYALADCGDPLAADVYDRMMALRDDSGAWVEYYVDGQPSGCRCRPWESGINNEAAIKYAR